MHGSFYALERTAGWIRLGRYGPGIAYSWRPDGFRYFSEREGCTHYIALGSLVLKYVPRRTKNND